METKRREHRGRPRRRIPWRAIAPVFVFGALLFLGPFLFGAVDRVVQIGLLALLAAGLWIRPLTLTPLSPLVKWFAAAVCAMIAFKEFAPHSFFGGVKWRTELANVHLALPATHNPEPFRALDGMLAAMVALVWFVWVRSLAADRTRRVWMAWVLGAAGAFLALVCFTMKMDPIQPKAIYGIRYTEGWLGWGPFPNRNHTASFLAMAGLCCGGCLLWAIAKGLRVAAVAAGALMLASLAALLASQSRGGLVAFGAGILVLTALVLWKRRDRRTLLFTLCGLLLVVFIVLTFGGKVIERFSSREGGMVSNETRVLIWNETLRIWKDAPLFGHGIETFTQIFPLYQVADLDGKTVLHPESSWLLWLTEFGAVPVLLLFAGLLVFVAVNLRAVFEQRRSFYLAAGALAGVAALLVHAMFDVPAHRWATAGFALALLGVAFPIRAAETNNAPRWIAALPLALGVFWVWPLIAKPPAWSPLAPTMILNRETTKGAKKPSLVEYEEVLKHFPLNAWLHQYAGMHALAEKPKERALWEQHFTIVRRMAASAWWLPVMQARAAKQFPSQAIIFWQDAVQRAGRQRGEVMRDAVRETGRMKGARVLWGQFVEAHPEVALSYAEIIVEELREPDDNIRAYYELWWEKRAEADVAEDEVLVFYRYASRWSSPEQLEQWMKRHASRRSRDYRVWMELLHGWKQDERAWQIYSGVMPEPPFGEAPKSAKREVLENRYRLAPENAAHALAYAQALDAEGDKAGAEKIIFSVAKRADAPPWFIRKAAYLLASEKNFTAAVETALREKQR